MWQAKKSNIHGIGNFASEDIPKNTMIEVVAFLTWSDFSGLYEITEFGRQTNHQTNCNCELRLEAGDSYWLYSIKDIKEGSELVANYKKAPCPPFKRNIKGFVEK